MCEWGLVPHDPSRALTSRAHKPVDITCVYIVLYALLSGKSKSQSLNVSRAIIKNQLRYVIEKHVAIKINVIVSHTLSGLCALNNCVLREEAGEGGTNVNAITRLGGESRPLYYCNCFVGGCFCVVGNDVELTLISLLRFINGSNGFGNLTRV